MAGCGALFCQQTENYLQTAKLVILFHTSHLLSPLLAIALGFYKIIN